MYYLIVELRANTSIFRVKEFALTFLLLVLFEHERFQGIVLKLRLKLYKCNSYDFRVADDIQQVLMEGKVC